MTMITKITMMMKKAQIFAGLLEDGNCDIRHCVLYVYYGRRVAILMIFIVYCVLSVTMIWKRKQLLIKLLNLNFSNWNICRMAGGWQFWWYDNIWYSVFLSVTIWYDKENKFWPNFWKLKYLQDGRRVARPQSVADMEELGRDLENMQIVNSRLVAEYL